MKVMVMTDIKKIERKKIEEIQEISIVKRDKRNKIWYKI